MASMRGGGGVKQLSTEERAEMREKFEEVSTQVMCLLYKIIKHL